MAARYYTGNSAGPVTTTPLTASDTTVTVEALVGYPTSFPYTAILELGSSTKEEAVTVTAASGTTLTVIRGVDSPAKVHSTGATFVHGVSAIDFQSLSDAAGPVGSVQQFAGT